MSHIDAGDRVIVTEGVREDTYKRKACPELEGKHGQVIDNDGWGLCTVLLDGHERMVSLWNSKDLKRE